MTTKITLIGRTAKADYYAPDTWHVFLQADQAIDRDTLDLLIIHDLSETEALLQDISTVELLVGSGCNHHAIAVVEAQAGVGIISVNGEPLWSYFDRPHRRGKEFLLRLLDDPTAARALAGLECVVRVQGSSPETIQQIKAVAHALARVLKKYDPTLGNDLERRGYGGRRITQAEQH